MMTITIDIRHDGIDKGTHIDYKSDLIGLVDKEEKLIETKIYDFIYNLNDLLEESEWIQKIISKDGKNTKFWKNKEICKNKQISISS